MSLKLHLSRASLWYAIKVLPVGRTRKSKEPSTLCSIISIINILLLTLSRGLFKKYWLRIVARLLYALSAPAVILACGAWLSIVRLIVTPCMYGWLTRHI